VPALQNTSELPGQHGQSSPRSISRSPSSTNYEPAAARPAANRDSDLDEVLAFNLGIALALALRFKLLGVQHMLHESAIAMLGISA